MITKLALGIGVLIVVLVCVLFLLGAVAQSAVNFLDRRNPDETKTPR